MPIQLKSMKIQMNETKIFLFSIFIRRYIFSVYLHLMNLHVNFENGDILGITHFYFLVYLKMSLN